MKFTLLEIVQNILNAMDSDEVNSISDTIESEQVANIVRDVYYNLVTVRDYAYNFTTFQLIGLGDLDNPTKMQLPEHINNISSVKYNKITSGGTRRDMQNILYISPQEFLDLIDARNDTASNVKSVVDETGILLNILNDAGPKYYTSFDDESILMDAYDVAVESTLVTSKTECVGVEEPSFDQPEPSLWAVSTTYPLGSVIRTSAGSIYKSDITILGGVEPTHTSGTVLDWKFISVLDNYFDDFFVPDLPSALFPLLIAEAKSTCFSQIKQIVEPKSEQFAAKLRLRFQSKNWRLNEARPRFTSPNYGRK